MNDTREFQLLWQDYNHKRLTPSAPLQFSDFTEQLKKEQSFLLKEEEWLASERGRVGQLAAQAPHTTDGFVNWFEDLVNMGPGQNDALFPFLANHATREQMRWFLKQEVAGEAGFDDLVALTQLKLPSQAKLEMARNYWDEMGRGTEKGMHGPMLHRLVIDLKLESEPVEIVEEAVSLGNLLTALAYHRRYAYHAIGALGAIELTAPGRAAFVYQGLKRLGIEAHARQYYLLHSTLDVKHSESWNQEILAPLIHSQPEVAQWIAEGALMRLERGRRCFERYRQEFSLM